MAQSTGVSATQRVDDAPSLEQEAANRPHEERMLLYGGFLIGVTIAGFFLLYIVIAIAFGEQSNFAPHSLWLPGLF